MLPHAEKYICKLCNRVDLIGQTNDTSVNDF